jgi:hypothetical protein
MKSRRHWWYVHFSRTKTVWKSAVRTSGGGNDVAVISFGRRTAHRLYYADGPDDDVGVQAVGESRVCLQRAHTVRVIIPYKEIFFDACAVRCVVWSARDVHFGAYKNRPSDARIILPEHRVRSSLRGSGPMGVVERVYQSVYRRHGGTLLPLPGRGGGMENQEKILIMKWQ